MRRPNTRIADAGEPGGLLHTLPPPASDAVWHQFYQRLYAFVAKHVNEPADADDIIQEVFLRIHRRLDTLRDRDRLLPWLFQITRHAMVDYYRTAVKRREVPVESLPDRASESSGWVETVNGKAAKELSACLRPFLKELPAHYREALDRVELEGMTQRAAAEQLGLSVSGMKSRVQRGRKELRRLIETCCDVHLDRTGRVMDYVPRKSACNPCAEEKGLQSS